MASWKFCLLDVDHVMLNNVPVIRLFGVTDEGKSIVVFDDSFRPYFFVEPKEGLNKEDINNLKDRIFSLEVEGRSPDMVEDVRKKVLGKETALLKVTGSFPTDMLEYKQQIKERTDVKNGYEHNVPFYRKYLIDNGLKPTGWVVVEGKKYKSGINVDLSVKADKIRESDVSIPKLKTLAFSIEIVEENSEENIAMLSVRDSRGFRRVLSTQKIPLKNSELVATERDLIIRFIHIIRERNPDVIFGFNTDRRDMVKLDEKAASYGLSLLLGRDSRPVFFKRKGMIPSAYIRGRLHVDVLDFIEHILSNNMTSEALTLAMVSKELIGETKKHISEKEMKIIWLTGVGLDKMAEYSLKNSELALKLGKHILPTIFQFSQLTGMTPFDCCRLTYSQMVEGLMLKKTHQMNEVILNRPAFDEVQRRRRVESYEGGFVQIPKKGIYEKLALFDFRSLYPSIIVTFNISPETLNCGHESCLKNKAHDDDHYFCKNSKGFIPSIVEELITERMVIKKKMKSLTGQELQDTGNLQYALKTLANAFYGYMGFASSRWYSRVCAKAAASFGRFYIKQIMDMATREGHEVVYGDTDSLFIKMPSKEVAREFLKKANKTLPGLIEMEFKEMYKRGIFIETQTGVGAKKKYAMLDKNDNLVIRGLETRRRDWSSIAKDTQERVLLAILREKSTPIAIEIVAETIRRLKEGKVSMDDLVIYTQLTKPLDKYEQIGPHVAVAQKMATRGNSIKEGMTISYVITKGHGSISERAEQPDEAKNYDPDYYIENQVVPAAMRILSAVDVDKELLLRSEEQSNLSGFFMGGHKPKQLRTQIDP